RRLLPPQLCGPAFPVEAPGHRVEPSLRDTRTAFYLRGSAFRAPGAAIPDLADLDGGQVEGGAANRAGSRGSATFESDHGVTDGGPPLEGGGPPRHRERPSPGP